MFCPRHWLHVSVKPDHSSDTETTTLLNFFSFLTYPSEQTDMKSHIDLQYNGPVQK